MESREQRIATLATTLRSSGIAKSDSQARMMAEDMIGVEEHVQKDYEVEHARASEYLRTTKNLGTPRQTIQSEVKQEVKTEKPGIKSDSGEPRIKMESLYTSKDYTKTDSKPAKEYTDVNFGGKTLNQAVEHDTHNSAIEAIKAQISRQEVSRKESTFADEMVPVDDVVPGSVLHKDIEIIPATEEIEVLKKEIDSPVVSKILDASDASAIDTKSIETPTVNEILPDIQVPDVKDEPKVVSDAAVENPKLDAQKLIDMMEEDGKLEEHTREIKEKPKDVKPKEAYEENNIDLGSMFDFNKGTTRK